MERLRAMASAGVAAAAFSLTGCAEAGIGQSDAYAIGCPAVDSAVAGGSVAGKAAVAGLKQVRDSTNPNPETQAWLDAAIAFLKNPDPQKLPADAKRLIVDGCAANGHPLSNLKS